jgi:hypothetical protein
MPWQEDLAGFFDTENGDAVPCTVQGVAAAGIFDVSSELVLGDAIVRAPSLLLPATVAAAEGGTVTVTGQAGSYRIRQVLDLPPDGRLRQLVLARA